MSKSTFILLFIGLVIVLIYFAGSIISAILAAIVNPQTAIVAVLVTAGVGYLMYRLIRGYFRS